MTLKDFVMLLWAKTVEELSEESWYSEEVVRKVLDKLVDAGLLVDSERAKWN
jgi:predicted transcriptional regulator